MTTPVPPLRPSIYLDPSVIEDALHGRMRARDRAAVWRLAAMVSENVLSFCCPKEGRETIEHATRQQQARFGREYAALQVLQRAEPGWLDDDADGSAERSLEFRELADLLESAKDARRVLQARSAGIRDLVAAESSALVHRALELEARTGLRIFRPGDYLSRWSTQQQLPG